MSSQQARKWNLVINNPEQAGLTRERIIELLKKFSPNYFCIADEISTTGTPHTHIFIYSDSPIRFSTLKTRFPIAHIEKSYGSVRENRNYVAKEGKWSDTEKSETQIKGSFYESGEIPTEQAEKSPLMYQLLEDINNGKKTSEIIKEKPELAFRIREIENIRQTLLNDHGSQAFRQLNVTYIYGASGTGKTSSIYKQFPAKDICRITSYQKEKICFDGYHSQPVLVFEEFCSQIPIEEMLNYLDIYPLMLPARYNDRIANYTTVFITSNISLWEQYQDIQRKKPETWKAFLRRIHKVFEFRINGEIIERNKEEKK